MSSEYNIMQTATLSRPANANRTEWLAYWKAMGQEWRTEPEIGLERQAYLAQCLAIKVDLDEGVYQFRGVKLLRADVEWLLGQHENGRGPVDWHDPEHLNRVGIDLRGADLRGANLRGLPLSHMLGGLNGRERNRAQEGRDMAAVHLEGAILSEAHLERAELYMAHLERADFFKAHLAGASLRKAHLEGASLRLAYLAALEEQETKAGKTLTTTPLIRPLPPADLRAAFLDNVTDLRSAHLGNEKHGFVRLSDVHWADVNLAIIDWSLIKILGDEGRARAQAREKKIDKEMLVESYREAVRANRQLAVALQRQGLNEEATRFLYRAQVLQREVVRLQGRTGAYIFSAFLDILAGYGYQPIRSVLAYLLVITCFAILYFILGRLVGPHLSPVGALVFSVTSFHGRGFFPGGIVLDDPITIMAAVEAIIGLTIEISFIATFTQRFFGN
ncbi:MAG: hypothetical protein PVS3B3_36760 [Ktedonobacteraceae bacterium]